MGWLWLCDLGLLCFCWGSGVAEGSGLRVVLGTRVLSALISFLVRFFALQRTLRVRDWRV